MTTMTTLTANLIAIDPGDTVGICIFSPTGVILAMDQLPFESKDRKDFLHWLAEYDHPVEVVVFETWVTFRQHAAKMVGSKQKTSQGIGAIKAFALQKKATLIEQGSDILPVATKWSGLHMPSQHSKTHKYAAYLHGYYYLHQQGIIKSTVEPIRKDS